MPTSPFDLLFCLTGLLIVIGGVAIPVIMRREDLEWRERLLRGLKFGGIAAIAVTALFALVLLVYSAL